MHYSRESLVFSLLKETMSIEFLTDDGIFIYCTFQGVVYYLSIHTNV